MSFTLTDLPFLSGERGNSLLNELSQIDLNPRNTLSLVTSLRKTYHAEEVSAAVTMARLRAKGVEKFGVNAGRMFFTEDALEQASDPLIRAYRGGWARQGAVLDVCCGIGSDSLAFAAQGSAVLGLDHDEVRIAMARHNAEVTGLPARFEVHDVTSGIPDGFASIFFDPARRDEHGKRIYHVEEYLPPLKLVRSWQAERIMVKLSPGVQLDELAEYAGLLEFISVDGDLKEAVLHLGEGLHGLRATLLRAEGVLQWDNHEAEPDALLADPAGWLCEPDPALLRAGLVRMIAAAHGGRLLDETIAYFCCDSRPDSPWLRSWRIADWMPFHVKRLRALLRERGIGQVTVKKRGSPITPEELIPMLKLKGDQCATLMLTRLRGNPIVVICEY